jgi:hypothetical protein
MNNLWFKRLILPFAFLLSIAGLAIGNDYYTHGGFPATGSVASSASMRAELDTITAGFDKLPSFAGNASKAVIVNGGATALSVTTGTLSLAGNFAITGAFNTTLAQGATTTLTLPLVSGTLATLAGTETLTTKTINLSNNTLTGTTAQFNTALSDNDFATLAGAENLTNKTISSPTFGGTASGSITNLALTTPTVTSPTLAGTPVFPDNVFTVGGSSDASKKVSLEVDGLTTSTTRTHFVSDEDANSAQSWEIQNLQFIALVNASALTITIHTKTGNNPSATDPILFKFRHATAGTGDYTTVAMTANTQLVISSGSTLGTVSGVAHRLYLGVANDGGTLRLFLYNPLSSTLNLQGIQDDLLYSSTAEGGAGAADSAQTLYSGTAFTTKAVRLLGYIESTQATAGTWATTVSKIHMLKFGDKRTGDLVQEQRNTSGAMATGSTGTPIDDTIPQITEGNEYMTQAITPTSAINLLRVVHQGQYSSSVQDSPICALFQDATANALAALIGRIDVGGADLQFNLEWRLQALTISSTTFRIRVGTTNTGTITFNGDGGARKLGGVMASFMSVQEIMV